MAFSDDSIIVELWDCAMAVKPRRVHAFSYLAARRYHALFALFRIVGQG
jgi:hypothetical protein